MLCEPHSFQTEWKEACLEIKHPQFAAVVMRPQQVDKHLCWAPSENQLCFTQQRAQIQTFPKRQKGKIPGRCMPGLDV